MALLLLYRGKKQPKTKNERRRKKWRVFCSMPISAVAHSAPPSFLWVSVCFFFLVSHSFMDSILFHLKCITLIIRILQFTLFARTHFNQHLVSPYGVGIASIWCEIYEISNVNVNLELNNKKVENVEHSKLLCCRLVPQVKILKYI